MKQLICILLILCLAFALSAGVLAAEFANAYTLLQYWEQSFVPAQKRQPAVVLRLSADRTGRAEAHGGLIHTDPLVKFPHPPPPFRYGPLS